MTVPFQVHFQFNTPFMEHNSMLDYRKPQTSTAGFFKVTFINSVKRSKTRSLSALPIPQPVSLNVSTASPGITATVISTLPFSIILDPVVDKVINNLAQNCGHSFYISFTAADTYSDIFPGSLFLQTLNSTFNKFFSSIVSRLFVLLADSSKRDSFIILSISTIR